MQSIDLLDEEYNWISKEKEFQEYRESEASNARPRMPREPKRPNGIVIYRGPSLWDGEEIVVIATGLSTATKNSKTGPMLQTWVMREDIAPHIAARDGRDETICGDCPARPSQGGHCYVSTFQGPRSVWEAYKRGKYDEIESLEDIPAVGEGRRVRIGSYGDPAMVPVEIWRALVSRSTRHTGYTHQWDKPHAEPLRSLVMASCDSEAEAREARESGWRYFRVTDDVTGALEREVECLSESRGMSCYDCGLCDGARDSGLGKSVRITVHGARAKRYTKTLPVLEA